VILGQTMQTVAEPRGTYMGQNVTKSARRRLKTLTMESSPQSKAASTMSLRAEADKRIVSSGGRVDTLP
jgi:hypothetical protein